MGIFVSWISANWFSALQAFAITAGLCFNAYSLLVSTRARKVDTLINITQQHRSIWLKFLDSPNLKRILAEKVDLHKHPMTDDETMFVNLVILHLTTVLIAVRQGIFLKPAGLDVDIGDFFSRPIPNAVWHRMKAFRDPETAHYIESLWEKPRAGNA